MKLLFSGGGTLGPVTPLIAVINEIKKSHPKDEIFWVSTKKGKENNFLHSLGIKTYPISSAKLRRYASVENFVDIWNFVKALFESYFVIKKINPDVIISAGGYVSVPLVIVGKLMRKKIFIHQQDIQIGLANKIMSYFADFITVSFAEQVNNFKTKNICFTGNPCRFTSEDFLKLNRENLIQKYNFKNDKPIILILGGSSGANSLNDAIYNHVEELSKKSQVIHATGVNKGFFIEKEDYMQVEFLYDEALEFMFLSDIVVSRAGLATLTELSSIGKCSIVVPLAGHQEYNAKYFQEKNCADVCSVENLYNEIIGLLDNKSRQIELAKNISNIMPKNSTQKIIEKIYGLKKI